METHKLGAYADRNHVILVTIIYNMSVDAWKQHGVISWLIQDECIFHRWIFDV